MLLARAPVRISFAGGGTDLPDYCTRFGGMVARVGFLWECEWVLGLRGEPFSVFMLARLLPPEPPRLFRRWAWRLRSAVATSRLGKLPGLLNVLRRRTSLVGPGALVQSEEVMPQL